MHLFLPLRAIMTSSIRKNGSMGDNPRLLYTETRLVCWRVDDAVSRPVASRFCWLLWLLNGGGGSGQDAAARRGADPVGADELCRAIAELLNGSRAYVVMESYAHYHRRAKTTAAAHVPVDQVNTQASCSAQGRRESWPSSMFQPTDISSKANMIDRS